MRQVEVVFLSCRAEESLGASGTTELHSVGGTRVTESPPASFRVASALKLLKLVEI